MKTIYVIMDDVKEEVANTFVANNDNHASLIIDEALNSIKDKTRKFKISVFKFGCVDERDFQLSYLSKELVGIYTQDFFNKNIKVKRGKR